MDLQDGEGFLATQEWLVPIEAEVLTTLYSIISLKYLIQDARASFLFGGRAIKFRGECNEFAFEILLGTGAAGALFFIIEHKAYLVNHTLLGSVSLSRSQALERGLELSWPHCGMRIRCTGDHTNATACATLTSLLKAWDEGLTPQVFQHPLLFSPARPQFTSAVVLMDAEVRLTVACQRALDPPLTREILDKGFVMDRVHNSAVVSSKSMDAVVSSYSAAEVSSAELAAMQERATTETRMLEQRLQGLLQELYAMSPQESVVSQIEEVMRALVGTVEERVFLAATKPSDGFVS